MAGKITVNVPGFGDVVVTGAASEATLEKIVEILDKTATKTKKAKKIDDDNIDSLNKGIQELADAIDKGTDQIGDRQRLRELQTKKFIKEMQKTTVGLKDFGVEVTDLAMGIDGSIGTIGTISAFVVMKMTGLGKTLSTMIKKMAIFSGKLGPVGKGLGGLVAGLAIAGGALVGFVVGQLQNTIETFENLSGAGALFAGGLEDLKKTQVTSMLTLSQFNQMVQNSTESLILLGGTVADGTRKLAVVNNIVVKQFGAQLYGLGIALEEGAEMIAEYMASQQLMGRLQTMTIQQQADASFDYIKNIKTLSTLTGKSIREIRDKMNVERLKSDVFLKSQEMVGKGFVDYGLKAGAIITRMSAAGEPFGNMMRDWINDGKLQSQESLKLAALYPVTAQMMKEMQLAMDDATNKTKSKTDMDIILQRIQSKHAKVVGEEAKIYADIVKTIPAGLNPLVDLMHDTVTGLSIYAKRNAEIGKDLDGWAESVRKAGMRDEELQSFRQSMQTFQLAIDEATYQLQVSPLMKGALGLGAKFFKNVGLIIEHWDVAVERFPQNIGKILDKIFKWTFGDDFVNNMNKLEADAIQWIKDIDDVFISDKKIGQKLAATASEWLEGIRKSFPTMTEYGNTLRNIDYSMITNATIDAFMKGVDKIANIDYSKVAKALLDKFISGVDKIGTAIINLDAVLKTKFDDMADWLILTMKTAFKDLFAKIANFSVPDWMNPSTWGKDDKKDKEGMKLGGVSRYPATGGMEVLHGTEAVIPLPDGNSVPVTLSGPKMAPITVSLDGSNITIKEDLSQLTTSFKDIMDAQTANTTTVVQESNQNTVKQLENLMEKQLEESKAMVAELKTSNENLESQLRVLRDVQVNL